MFTGIIDHCGIIHSISKTAEGLQVIFEARFTDLNLGESIAVNGVCLTVCKIDSCYFYCDISPETLALTTATHFHVGQAVNLERALRPTDRLGGHFVLGHVDRTATIKTRRDGRDYIEFSIGEFTTAEKKLLIHKGCVAVNGVSLTINSLADTDFQLLLVPHTLEKTQLNSLKSGDSVNIEFDYLAKIVTCRSD